MQVIHTMQTSTLDGSFLFRLEDCVFHTVLFFHFTSVPKNVTGFLELFCVMHLQIKQWTFNNYEMCSWAHAVISALQSCRFLMKCCLSDHDYSIFVVGLAHRSFSGFSKCFNKIMNCRSWNLQIHCNFIFRKRPSENVLLFANYVWVYATWCFLSTTQLFQSFAALLPTFLSIFPAWNGNTFFKKQ